MQSQYNFPITHWAKGSTEVKFMPMDKIAPSDQITSCFVFAIHDNQLLMIRPERGWGLPGGHKELGESPEECVRREALEEACVELGDLYLIGGWEAKKILKTEKNAKYPDVAYQILYFANVTKVMPFSIDFEVLERAFVNINEVPAFHADYSKFESIFLYTLDKYKLNNVTN